MRGFQNYRRFSFQNPTQFSNSRLTQAEARTNCSTMDSKFGVRIIFFSTIILEYFMVSIFAISNFSQLLSTFSRCWTEVAFLGTEKDLVNTELLQSVTFPKLVSNPGQRVNLYSTLQGNQTIQLKMKCLVLILISSDWMEVNSFSAAHRTLHRYPHISGGRGWNRSLGAKMGGLWHERLFKSQSSFVLGLFRTNFSEEQDLFLKIQEECRCITIKTKVDDGGMEFEIGKLMYNQSMSTSQSKLTSISSLQVALLPSLRRHFINHTKIWIVDMWKDILLNRPCITSSPLPSVLLKLSELAFSDIHFVHLLIEFLSHGKYGVSLAHEMIIGFKIGFTAFELFGNNSCFKIEKRGFGRWPLDFGVGNVVWMRDHALVNHTVPASSASHQHLEMPISVSLLLSTFVNDFNFVSCDGWRREFNSFTVYFRPFPLEVWTALLFALSVLSALGVWFVRNFKLPDTPWMVFYAVVLETGAHVSKKIQSTRVFSTVMLPLFFACMILSQGYKGILTTDLTAVPPLKGLETFDDVIKANFSILSELKMNPLVMIMVLCENEDSVGNNKQLKLRTTFFTEKMPLLLALKNSIAVYQPNSTSQVKLDRVESYTKIGKLALYPPSAYPDCNPNSTDVAHIVKGVIPDPVEKIYSEVTKCEKTVYALPTEQIYSLIARAGLAASKNPLYAGQEEKMGIFKFTNQYYALLIKEEELDSIYIRTNVEALSTGGFLHYWESLKIWPSKRKYESIEDKFQRNLAPPSPLKLESNCATMFLIYIIGSALAILVIIGEWMVGFLRGLQLSLLQRPHHT